MGQRYAVPLDWSQPLAMGTFYETIMKPALEAIGLPANRPASATAPAVRSVRLHDYTDLRVVPTFGERCCRPR